MSESTSTYAYVGNNPILMIDPNGMLAKYNWETGQYEDNGKVVNFDYVQSQYEIGDYAASITVMLFPIFGSDGPKDPDGFVQGVFNEANKIRSDEIRIIQVTDIDDAVAKIIGISATINNLIIASHGFGQDGQGGYFKIGGSKVESASQVNHRYSKEFNAIAEKLAKNAQVILLACHAGASHNKGVEIMTALAKKLNATVFGNQSWTVSSDEMFNTRWYYLRYYPKSDGIPPNHAGEEGVFKNAIRDAGKWTKVTPNGVATTIINVYFDSKATIHYDIAP